jgi:hypothetical protein
MGEFRARALTLEPLGRLHGGGERLVVEQGRLHGVYERLAVEQGLEAGEDAPLALCGMQGPRDGEAAQVMCIVAGEMGDTQSSHGPRTSPHSRGQARNPNTFDQLRAESRRNQSGCIALGSSTSPMSRSGMVQAPAEAYTRFECIGRGSYGDVFRG